MIVLDTHGPIWVVDGDGRLGRTARAAIEEAGRADGIAVSAITPWEITLHYGVAGLNLLAAIIIY